MDGDFLRGTKRWPWIIFDYYLSVRIWSWSPKIGLHLICSNIAHSIDKSIVRQKLTSSTAFRSSDLTNATAYLMWKTPFSICSSNPDIRKTHKMQTHDKIKGFGEESSSLKHDCDVMVFLSMALIVLTSESTVYLFSSSIFIEPVNYTTVQTAKRKP
ncbi:hypothetical protein VNO78_25269 [Psophocarpus tetragonolobus]|uniref:Uncharacterized protein n=1 Tax=Psophocarpus tetragonolobus TaxID=3891 RepID=A0AAN9S689_PSOTE